MLDVPRRRVAVFDAHGRDLVVSIGIEPLQRAEGGLTAGMFGCAPFSTRATGFPSAVSTDTSPPSRSTRRPPASVFGTGISALRLRFPAARRTRSRNASSYVVVVTPSEEYSSRAFPSRPNVSTNTPPSCASTIIVFPSDTAAPACSSVTNPSPQHSA